MADAGTDVFKHVIGKPKKTNKVFIEIKFETDGGTKFKEIVEVDIDKDDTPVKKAGKIVTAINDKIAARPAASRGAEATQGKLVFPSETEVLLAEVYVTNMQGFTVKSVKYDSRKTGENIKKRKVPLAMLDPGGGLLDPREQGREYALVVFQGEPTAGTVQLGLGDRTLAVADTKGARPIGISEVLLSQLSEAGWDARITELAKDDDFGEGQWDHGLMISSLEGNAVFVDVNDEGMGYAVELSTDTKTK